MRAMPSRSRRESAAGGQKEDEATEEDDRDSTDSTDSRRMRAMEMTARNLCSDSNADEKICDGLIKRNGGDTEITVPLSYALSCKRISPTEGDNLHRLRDRKFLLEDKRRLCAWALATALFGITLMILHNELCPVIYQAGSVYAQTLNSLVSISTGCLVILIMAFHYKDVRLFVIDHNLMDWRIAMTKNRVLGISLELLVCAVHPVATYWWSPEAEADGQRTPSPPQEASETNASSPLCLSTRHKALRDVEILMSAMMFLRLYLVHRTIMLHSKVLLNASYRTIGSLNKINFSFRFLLKVLMNKYPARTLLLFILLFWFLASWTLTLCERQMQKTAGNMDTALWLTAITFLTVGYGDVSPVTSCGKVVCLFTGLMGVASTAMMVAVMTRKLALNKGEKHVHYFMTDIQITKRVRHAAANVLRECWLLHRTDVTKGSGREHRYRQRRLLEAIRVFRQLRVKQRKLRDYASEMVDLEKMQMIMYDLSANWNNSYHELELRILSMEQKLDELNHSLQQTSQLLTQVMGRQSLERRHSRLSAPHR
ncbi:intermediate conductance calcium-activated potassium channel protein 4 [Sardina pilchardus]|uniref:intermediate conductance calcium-activated potassium channel protein 4 n=1 Tax=Sardina pilchardus TaxID=27697 RepID=UPI002E118DC9